VKDDAGEWTAVYGSWRRSRKAADREERELLGRRDRGSLAPTRGETLDGYLTDEWLPSVSKVSPKSGKPLSPTTRSRYLYEIGKIRPIIGSVRLADLRDPHVERLRDELLDADLAPQTVASVMKTLGQALKRAAIRGYIARNYADPDAVARPSGKPREVPVVTAERARELLDACRDVEPWDAAAHLALGLSLRREEALGLSWESVDLDARMLRVERTLVYDGGVHWGPPKTAAGERGIPIPEFVAAALRRHRRAQNERRLLLGEAWCRDVRAIEEIGGSDFAGDARSVVLDFGLGEPFNPSTFSIYWGRFARERGFGDLASYHALRHGCAHLLLAGAVPDAVALEILGHADPAILRRYQAVDPRLKIEAMRKLDELLGE
jgi:integrase